MLAEAILAQAQADRIIIQEFCPLAESIEWQLGQRYFQERGSGAFLGDARPVPYVINNDGTLSRRAAEVLFAGLTAADQAGTLEPDIFVLELGIGVGLFARYFLDAFRDLCLQHGKDYYDRLCYVAADRSEQMLVDACRHGIFAHHPGRYLLRVVDALQPERLLTDVALARQGPRPFRAVFLNYLLDCLPATVLEVDAHAVRQLAVRACLARGIDLSEHTPLSAAQLAHCAASGDSQQQQELLAIYGLLASEYAYHPVDPQQVPYGNVALAFARSQARGLLHSYGAIQCLERLLALIPEQGFILVNDYGPTEVTAAEDYEHQRFSHSTAIGVNFPLLKAYFGEAQRCRWVEPLEENESLHPRLLGAQLAHATVACFQKQFGRAASAWLQEPVHRARELVKIGRFEAAATSYRLALERQPQNWVLMNEIATLLTFTLGQPKAATDLAKVGLALNPLSTELWNTLGDSLYACGRMAEARQTYLRALQLNGSDVRARYNLAWVHTQEKDFSAALHQLAEALVLDQTGEYRERLLHKQREVLARLRLRQQQEYLRIANRIGTSASRLDPGNTKGVGQPTDPPGSVSGTAEQTTDF